MRPGMQTLLDLIRGGLHEAEIDPNECLKVLDIAQQENVLPWAASCLRRHSDHPAPEVEDRLSAIEREARISAFIWSATLRNTLAEFHRQGVPVISLKGPWLAQRLYGDAALRLYSDLDLLVRREDFARSESLLSGLGFVAALRRDDYARTFVRGDITLELHDDVENPMAFNFKIDRAWSRAQSADFEGVPAFLLAPSDELSFLCLHGARHRFERLSHILDLALAFLNLTSPQPERNCGSDRMLALGCMMAVRLDPNVAQFERTYAAIPARNSLEEIAENLWQERMVTPAPALNWSTKHLFMLSIERPGWDRTRARFRYLRILATRLISDDFAFASRFHLYRRWQVWMLRPVRLLVSARRALPNTSSGS